MRYIGLYTDTHEAHQPQGTARHAKNMVDSETLGTLENERGNVPIVLDTPLPYPVIGNVVMNNEILFFMTDNVDSEIGLVVTDGATGTYTTIYNDPALNFHRDFPIKGVFQTNSLGERLVAWIDFGRNTPRIINIDKGTPSSIFELDLFSTYTSPSLSTAVVNNTGGSLISASYIPLTRYVQQDNTKTNWTIHDKALQITPYSTSASVEGFKGGQPSEVSSKSITWTFDNLDQAYDKLEIGVLALVNGVIRARSVAVQEISGTGLAYTYTGNEAGTDITLEEALTPTASYTSAKAITQINNSLVLGNLTSADAPDYQYYANQIKVDYTYQLQNVTSLTENNHRTMALQPGFKSGEVYALYIILEMTNGTEYAYHIPGRGPLAADTQVIDESATNGLSYISYQIRDTCDQGGAVSNLGYWENQNEFYADDFPTGRAADNTVMVLANTRVRHHRFPTLDRFITTHGPSLSTLVRASIGISRLPVFGINVSNVTIPAEIRSQVVKWRIAYAKKSANTSLRLGQDLMFYNAERTSTDSSLPATNNVLFNGGNLNMRSKSGFFGASVAIRQVLDDSSLRGFSPDLLTNRPSAIPSYVYIPYVLYRSDLDLPYVNYHNGASVQVWSLHKNVTTDSIAGGLVMDSTDDAYARIPVSFNNNFHRINNFKYLSQNSLSDGISTIHSGDCIYMEPANPSFFKSQHGLFVGGIGNFIRVTTELPYTPASSVTMFYSPGEAYESTPLIEYCQQLTDVHVSFFDQELIMTDKCQTNSAATSLDNIFGGDTYVSVINYQTMPATGIPGKGAGTDRINSSTENAVFFRSYLAESRTNWNLRYPTETKDSEYYPVSQVSNFYNPAIPLPNRNESGTLFAIDLSTEVLNNVQVNRDYEFIPESRALIIKDIGQFSTGAPTTIIKSETQSLENLDVSWKTFLPNDRWVQPRNKGEITNLVTLNNQDLLIHHTHSLYRTKTQAGISGGVIDINLQSASLFAIPPQELVTIDKGYAGTQNPLACALTPYGYCFVDDSQGKIFLYNQEGLKEISKIGMRKFYRDNMQIKKDNIYLDKGYTIGHDLTYERILITQRDGAESWTASYTQNTEVPHWVSFHDYIPDFYIELANSDLITLKDSELYLQNVGAPGEFYGDIYSSFADFVYTDFNTAVLFNSLEWSALVYNSSNVLIHDDTFDYITAWTYDKCMGRVALEPLVNITKFYDSGNMRNLNQVWSYNGMRDIVIQEGFIGDFYSDFALDNSKLNINLPWYQKRLFVDTFLVTRYEYSNLAGNRIVLLNHGVSATPTIR